MMPLVTTLFYFPSTSPYIYLEEANFCVVELIRIVKMPSKYLYRSHQEVARAHFNDLNAAIQEVELEVDGSSLTLATVVAVSKYVCYQSELCR